MELAVSAPAVVATAVGSVEPLGALAARVVRWRRLSEDVALPPV